MIPEDPPELPPAEKYRHFRLVQPCRLDASHHTFWLKFKLAGRRHLSLASAGVALDRETKWHDPQTR